MSGSVPETRSWWYPSPGQRPEIQVASDGYGHKLIACRCKSRNMAKLLTGADIGLPKGCRVHAVVLVKPEENYILLIFTGIGIWLLQKSVLYYSLNFGTSAMMNGVGFVLLCFYQKLVILKDQKRNNASLTPPESAYSEI